MTALLSSTLAMILALALLLELLAAPLLLLWVVLSIRGSLARIADTLESNEVRNTATFEDFEAIPQGAVAQRERRIANSIFGR